MQGNTQVTATATDTAGNAISTSFAISVNSPFISITAGTSYAFSGPANAQILTISSGLAFFNPDAAIYHPNLTVKVMGFDTTLLLESAQHLAALTIDGGLTTIVPGHLNTLTIGSLSVMNNGALDLNDNALILTNDSPSTLSSIRSYLTTGRDAAAGQPAPWDGPGIISSYANQNGNGFNLAIGYADNIDLSSVRASGSYTSFGGQTVASNSVLVQLTRGADATLDGVVDGQDVATIGTHFQKPGSGQWCFGDFDYSGTCDGSDVAVLGTTFGKTSPVLSPAQLLTPIIQSASSVQTASPAVATDTSVKLFSSTAIPWNSTSQDHRRNRPSHSLSAMDRINKPSPI